MIDFLVRIGKPAAIIAAILGVAGDAYHFTLDDRSEVAQTLAYRSHGIALMLAFLLVSIALVRMAVVHDDRWRLVGRAGFLLALAGTITTIADIWAETIVLPGITAATPALLDNDASGFHLGAVAFSFLALFALGWLLVGIATFQARRASRASAILLAVAAIPAGLPIGGSYILLLISVAWVSWTLPGAESARSLEDM